jgi:NAD(P)-dependent dehydrogenase (short-subunit alcohol dehydrogenase family)
MGKIIVITGASSSFGTLAARLLAMATSNRTHELKAPMPDRGSRRRDPISAAFARS